MQSHDQLLDHDFAKFPASSSLSYSSEVIFQCNLIHPYIILFVIIIFASASSLLSYSVTEVTVAEGQKGWKQVLNFNLSRTPSQVPH